MRTKPAYVHPSAVETPEFRRTSGDIETVQEQARRLFHNISRASLSLLQRVPT